MDPEACFRTRAKSNQLGLKIPKAVCSWHFCLGHDSIGMVELVHIPWPAQYLSRLHHQTVLHTMASTELLNRSY